MGKILRTVEVTIVVIVSLLVVHQLFFQSVLPPLKRASFPPPQRICEGQLYGLANGMRKRAGERPGKPIWEPNWCDVICDELNGDPRNLVCPEAKTKPCSYALNRSVVGLDQIPGDVVVLFDSEPGWNLVGGPELLSPENHGGRGCNVLFGEFEVRFVEKKDLAQLKWRVELANENSKSIREAEDTALVPGDKL